ncbi:protein O-mannosyltransferase 1-like [Artemia franciscana]|uniref:Protein O-mannosyltransferase 1 n=1 Tax=Artemia franciscana TaxID=6661 RepID=A0AA88L1R0_ARTSF|nr:hypothetical protein QYM36_016758 [Artemia franciscana]KAK2704461.1 hypothetical protein QYM36_016758 [Artemia franciscana]
MAIVTKNPIEATGSPKATEVRKRKGNKTEPEKSALSEQKTEEIKEVSAKEHGKEKLKRRDSKEVPLSTIWRPGVMMLLLFAIAAGLRFYRLSEPNSIVFDELHYGRYAGLYLKKTFFFDSHPPLGKQMLALAGYLAGFNATEYKFEKIGNAYNESVPVFAMRMVPALCGSLVVPLAYQIMLLLGFHQWTAALTAFLFAFDNSLVTQSHFMLMESILMFFSLSGIMCILRFRQNSTKDFSFGWWFWLSSGVALLTCANCVKYVGFYSLALGAALVGHEFWVRVLARKDISRPLLWKHIITRGLAFSLIPSFIYLAVFYVHLSILTNAGPHDSAMSSAFQASLEGGLASIVSGQPLEVVHGSQVTLRHTHGNPCWLHSHDGKYPIKYSDGRGSSHQQQVTCYGHKDVNNWWIVKRPERDDIMVSAPLDRIKHGDIIQLVHGLSGRPLNTHNVAAPLTATKQEISCYINYNVSMDPQILWRVDIVNKNEVGDIWHALESIVRLVHVNTSAALSYSGRTLPDWGFHQQEVVGDIQLSNKDNNWNVEEHRYTRNEEKEDLQRELMNTDFIPLEPVKLNFIEKFLELQIRMLFITNENVPNHMYTSSPWEWLLINRGIAYWISPTSNAQIQLLGNVAIWYTSTGLLTLYAVLLVIYLLRQRRECYDLSEKTWNQFVTIGEVFLIGYAIHFAPFFFVDHTLFLHHYLPAYAFKLLLAGAMAEHVLNAIRDVYNRKWLRQLVVGLIIGWIVSSVYIFNKFKILTYGIGSGTATEILDLKWKDSWDFIIHKS